MEQFFMKLVNVLENASPIVAVCITIIIVSSIVLIGWLLYWYFKLLREA